MKCPKCGEEMPENALYCEKCGEDIHIIPDFEPEVERNLQTIISGIAEEVTLQQKEIDLERKQKKQRQHKIACTFLAGAVLIYLCFMVGWMLQGILFDKHEQSKDYQVKKARSYTEKGKVQEAISYYEKAISLDPGDVSIVLELADLYFEQNRKRDYEATLKKVLVMQDVSVEQLSSTYGKLIALYRNREDYQSIYEMLIDCGNEKIIKEYADYIPPDPIFSLESGEYKSVQPLKLSTNKKADIYYTLDGEEPDLSSTPYTVPIILEDGEHIVKVCTVNSYGAISHCFERKYHIEVEDIPAPIVSPISGTYQKPMLIEIDNAIDNVYYTTDGSEPNEESYIYTEPIPMPIGKSVFKFAKIVDGKVGDLSECKYNLKLDTDFTPEQACAVVTEYEIRQGKIKDAEGHFNESESKYQYSYQYVIDITQKGHYYVIAEVFYDSGDFVGETGLYYAVEVYSGSIYILQRTNENNYQLVEIQ